MVDGKYPFNFFICLFEPNTINSVLCGLSLSLLADIHSFTSSRHRFNFAKAADEAQKCIYLKSNFDENFLTPGYILSFPVLFAKNNFETELS